MRWTTRASPARDLVGRPVGADVTNVVKQTQFKSPREDPCYKRRQSKQKNQCFQRKSRWIDDVCNNTHQTTPKLSMRDPRDAHRERRGLAATPMVGDDTTASQMSHVIYRGHFLRHPTNVAIPTIHIQCLNEAWRNYVRSCWLTAKAGLRDEAPSQPPAHQAPLVWSAPEGPEKPEGQAAVSVGGRAWQGTPEPQAPPVWRAPEGPAAVPVGGGRAWPGFETTRRAKLAARAARGRAAARRHTQRPGPPAPGTPAAPQKR